MGLIETYHAIAQQDERVNDMQELSNQPTMPKTAEEWMTALAAHGFKTRAVEAVRNFRDLNNFHTYWPKGLDRTFCAPAHEPFVGRAEIEECLWHARQRKYDLPQTLKSMELHSKRFLEEPLETFYDVLDATLRELDIPTDGPEYSRFMKVWYECRSKSRDPETEEEKRVTGLVLTAYQKLRALGYSHFDLIG